MVDQPTSVHPSLKWRLLRLVTGILFLALFCAAVSIIENARYAIRAEGDAFAQFALQVLQETIYDSDTRPREFDSFRLRKLIAALDRLPHVKIVSAPRSGHWQDLPPSAAMQDTPKVPRWFASLLTFHQADFFRGLIDSGAETGTFLVMADPSEEIEEVWEDVRPLLWLAAGLLLVVWLLLNEAVRYSLAPLADLSAGLDRMERGDFSGRVREDVVLELHRIHSRFNWIAGVLRDTMEDNRTLAGHMVSLREDERLDLARELHDELAPHLFGIKMNVSTAIMDIDNGKDPGSLEKLQAISDLVKELEQRVRRILHRLRPAALDEFGLNVALQDLVDSWRNRMGNVNWRFESAGDIDALNDTVRVTAYRIAQECLTNAAKHSSASDVLLNLALVSHGTGMGEELEIIVQDDGEGMPADRRPGFGLRGMQERVRALGGSVQLSPADSGGFRIHVRMPAGSGSPVKGAAVRGIG